MSVPDLEANPPGDHNENPTRQATQEALVSGHGRVFQALGDQHNQFITVGNVERVVPRQLPPAPRRFAGREVELGVLTDMLDTAAESGATVVVSAIGGVGGIGKTWLSVHWAHEHLEWFPDGQLFVDLRGFAPTGEPMSVGEAVRGFLHALGEDPATLPVDLDAQVGLYRSLVADRRMLIVLDNARDTPQIAPLLPGPGMYGGRDQSQPSARAGHSPRGLVGGSGGAVRGRVTSTAG